MKKTLIQYTLIFILVLSKWLSSSALGQATVNLNELRMSSAVIIVKDLKSSASWYYKYLKFKIKEFKPEKHVKMTHNGFQLTLRKGKSTLLLREITFTKGKKYVNGINKLGFTSNQFDSLNFYLQRHEQKFMKPASLDQNIGKQTMIVYDPDGNQIFLIDEPSDPSSFILKPNFLSINSSDYITTLKWYTTHLGFEEIELKDDSNAHFQSLLRKDDIILELIHLPYESLETTEFMPIERDLASFDRVVFEKGLAKKVISELDNNGNKIVIRK
ncbi:MAG: VOC family protein [Reichenbachiella sp.]